MKHVYLLFYPSVPRLTAVNEVLEGVYATKRAAERAQKDLSHDDSYIEKWPVRTQ